MTGERAGSLWWKRSCLLVVLTLLTALLLPALPAPAAPTDRLVVAGSFPRPGGTGGRANGELLVRASTRRIYQAVRTTGMTVTEYDADTFRKLRSVDLPRFAVSLTTIGESAWLWTIDDQHGRLFAVVMTEGFGEYTYSLLTLDLKTLRSTVSEPLYARSRAPLAISYHAGSDRLYILSKIQMNAARDVAFLEERDTSARQIWEHTLVNCAFIGDDLLAPVVARSVLNSSRIYLNCYTKNIAQSALNRITLGPNGVVEDEIFPAVPKAVSGVLFDPGSDRIFFLATNGGAGRGVWVFDGGRGQFLGVIASGDTRTGENDYAIGLDERTGRIYVQTPAGFLVADARRTPLDAGYVFRELAGPGLAPIHVDSGARRIFAPDPRGTRGQGWPTSFLVLQDDIHLTKDPPPPVPDSLTINVPEKPGVTGRTYAGSAGAYAVRSLTTGGVQRAVWNAALTDFDPAGIPEVWPALQGLPLSNGNRDVVAGRVMRVTLTPDSADGRASAATADGGTVTDLKSAGVAWPYPVSECHTSAEAVSDDDGNSSVTCDPRRSNAAASSGLRTVPLAVPGAGHVRADAVWAEGSARLDPAGGLVTESMAVVKGLSLFGVVRIGELRAAAVVGARGRPGSARAFHEREIFDVWIAREGEAPYTCGICDPREVLRQINRALTGTATATMPDPDPAFYPKGSPGGYQSVVTRKTADAMAARSLNDDDALEVPGLELIVYSDGRAGRSRHILQFAAVSAEAHYGIFLLPTSVPDELPSAPEVSAPSGPAPAPVAPPTRVEGRRLAKTETAVESIVKRVALGYGLLGVRPGQAALLGALWAFLLLPGYLLVRRRMIT